MATDRIFYVIIIALILGGGVGLGTRFIIYQIKKNKSKLSFGMSALIGGGASLLTGGLYCITSVNSLMGQMSGFSSMFGVNQFSDQMGSIMITSILIGIVVSIVAVVVMYNRQNIKK